MFTFGQTSGYLEFTLLIEDGFFRPTSLNRDGSYEPSKEAVMAVMAPLLSCPICHRTSIKPLFEDLGISIDVHGKLKKVGGLSTFMCTVENHIFFVRTADLTEYRQEVSSALGWPQTPSDTP